LSVTEGDDKPLKYPNVFHAADLMLLNKIDLLPYVRFDMNSALEAARQVNPTIGVFAVSALTGDGLSAWLEWIIAGVDHARERRQMALLARRAALQHELDSIDLQF
jgi:hydrogenase nickel incorporation protein HypB